MQHELAPHQSLADALQALVVAAQVMVVLGVEQVVAVLAGELGLVHRLVGLAQQLVGRDLLALRVERDADAARYLQRLAIHLHRLGHGGQQAAHQRPAAVGIGQLTQHGDELVAAQTGERVALAHRLAHAPRQRHQQLVTGVVPLRVIDGLEAVEVDIDHGQALATALSAGHGLVQAIGKQDSVGQRGQRVVMRDALELALMLLLRRDVGEKPDEVPDLAARIAHRADGEQFGEQFAALAPVPHLAIPVALLQQALPHRGMELRSVAVGFEQAGLVPEHFVPGVAGDARERLVDLDDAAAHVGHDDAFARMREHRRREAGIGVAAVAQARVTDRTPQGLAVAPLGQVVVGTRGDRQARRGRIVETGQHHDRRLGQRAAALHGDRSERVRQVQVQEHHVGLQVAAGQQGLCRAQGIGDVDDEALVQGIQQLPADQFDIARFILDQQDLGGCERGRVHRWVP